MTTQKIQPEHIRKSEMNRYADLQIFKLKVCVVLGFALWASQGFPLP